MLSIFKQFKVSFHQVKDKNLFIPFFYIKECKRRILIKVLEQNQVLKFSEDVAEGNN